MARCRRKLNFVSNDKRESHPVSPSAACCCGADSSSLTKTLPEIGANTSAGRMLNAAKARAVFAKSCAFNSSRRTTTVPAILACG